MREQMYSVRVIDYSLPSFCSGDKYYYGTKHAIMTLLSKSYEDDSDVLNATSRSSGQQIDFTLRQEKE